MLMEVKLIIITLLLKYFHFMKSLASGFGLLYELDFSVRLIAGALNSSSGRRELKLCREMCDSGMQMAFRVAYRRHWESPNVIRFTITDEDLGWKGTVILHD